MVRDGRDVYTDVLEPTSSSALDVKGCNDVEKDEYFGEVAQQAGIQPSAIRYYESEGLLPAPERVNGRRKYDARVLQRIRADLHDAASGVSYC